MRAELSGKVRKRLTHLHAVMHMGVDSAAPHCLLIWRLKEVLLTDAAQLPWMRMEGKALLLWHRRKESCLFALLGRGILLTEEQELPPAEEREREGGRKGRGM